MTRLTEEMVIARAKQSDLASIKKLNCWGSDLTDVSILKRMKGVEVLALSVNNISTLQPFQDCQKLQELYLRKNNLTDIDEVLYLQNLPFLRYLWLEENPFCATIGPGYRAMILRALPTLKKLDNVDVTKEEVEDALRNAESLNVAAKEESEDGYENYPGPSQHNVGSPQSQQSPQERSHSPPHQRYQQQPQSARAPPQVQHSRNSPQKESQQVSPQQLPQRKSPDQVEEVVNGSSEPASPSQAPYQSSQSPRYSEAHYSAPIQSEEPRYVESNAYYTQDAEPRYTEDARGDHAAHPPEPRYNEEYGHNYPQYHRSPGSDQDSPMSGVAYRDRTQMPPSMSSHSMKEYYQSERPAYPPHYRHSQTDLSEWEEHHPQAGMSRYGSNAALHYPRRNMHGNGDHRDDRYAVRNGIRENGDMEPRRVSESRLNQRRPTSRTSNILSATLCLIKELDHNSLEVVEHAARCRINELSSD